MTPLGQSIYANVFARRLGRYLDSAANTKLEHDDPALSERCQATQAAEAVKMAEQAVKLHKRVTLADGESYATTVVEWEQAVKEGLSLALGVSKKGKTVNDLVQEVWALRRAL